MPERKDGGNPFEGLSAPELKELKRWVDEAGIEVLPNEASYQKVIARDVQRPVDVTSSPKLGISATKNFSLALVNNGRIAVPHAAFRNIPDEEFEDFFTSLGLAGIKTIVAIAGDNIKPEGTREDSLGGLKDMVTFGYKPEVVEVAGYPRHHDFIEPIDRDRALWEKANFLEKNGIEMHIKTQICAYPKSIAKWLRHIRHDLGIDSKVIVGLLGPVKLQKANEHMQEVGVDEITHIIKRIRTGNVVEDFSLPRFDVGDYLEELMREVEVGEIHGVCFNTFGDVNLTLDKLDDLTKLTKDIF